MNIKNKSKTKATIAAYHRINKGNMRYADLMRERGELGDTTDANLLLAMAVVNLEPRVQPSTARQYRAAAIYEIESNPGLNSEFALEILQPEMNEVQEERQHLVNQQRKEFLTELRGSQQRAEHLSENDWQTLFSALNASKSEWGKIAVLWFACTLITGLRPCEWERAYLKDKALVVVNAKATNGRAHGLTRTLDFYKADINTLILIASFLEIVDKNREKSFVKMYDGVRNIITKIARVSLSRRKRYPTLYTARHAFSSKAKTEFTKRQVAALMGHASIETAARHYAAARYGRGGIPLEVEPTYLDVRAVKLLEESKHQNLIN